jgi:hypothetical protein
MPTFAVPVEYQVGKGLDDPTTEDDSCSLGIFPLGPENVSVWVVTAPTVQIAAPDASAATG